MTGPSLHVTDEELVAAMRTGEERALSALYDRYSESIYSLAMSILRDAGEADEVVADAFLRLWNTTDYDPRRGSVGAYLAVFVRSRALDRVRTLRRQGKAEEARAARDPSGLLLPVAEVADRPDEELQRGEERARLDEALGTLTDKQRTVIGLAYFGGLTHREIAEELSEPIGTIKTRIRDGMLKLRDAFPFTLTST